MECPKVLLICSSTRISRMLSQTNNNNRQHTNRTPFERRISRTLNVSIGLTVYTNLIRKGHLTQIIKSTHPYVKFFGQFVRVIIKDYLGVQEDLFWGRSRLYTTPDTKEGLLLLVLKCKRVTQCKKVK